MSPLFKASLPYSARWTERRFSKELRQIRFVSEQLIYPGLLPVMYKIIYIYINPIEV